MNTTQRTPALQTFLDAFASNTEISPDFVESSDHPYSCTCDKCREWWREMGPEDDGTFGPFGETLPPKPSCATR